MGALADTRGWHSRGYLPHFDGGVIVQSITIRLANSIPAEIVAAWRDELAHLPARDAALKLRTRLDAYLDRGIGEAWLLDQRIADVVQTALLHFDGVRYDLHAWVIMPNHVHVVFTPQAGHSVSAIVHAWKSYTAKEANRILTRDGSFWQPDYFDRAIRDERHFRTVVRYIEANPTKVGLCECDAQWPYSSAHYR